MLKTRVTNDDRPGEDELIKVDEITLIMTVWNYLLGGTHRGHGLSMATVGILNHQIRFKMFSGWCIEVRQVCHEFSNIFIKKNCTRNFDDNGPFFILLENSC